MSDESLVKMEVERATKAAQEALAQAVSFQPYGAPSSISSDEPSQSSRQQKAQIQLEKRESSMAFSAASLKAPSLPVSDPSSSGTVGSSAPGGTGRIIFKDCSGAEILTLEWVDGIIVTDGEYTIESGCEGGASSPSSYY